MIYSTKDIKARVYAERKQKQFVRFSFNPQGNMVCLINAACTDLGGLTTRRAILQYDSNTNVLTVIPTLDTDRITTVALSRTNTAKSGRSFSVEGFFNFVGIKPEPGRYLAKGTPDGVEIYLNAPL